MGRNPPQPSGGAPASPGSRALWTFLFYTLAGPFFAGLTVAAALIIAPLFGLTAWLPPALPPVGVAAVSAFLWAAIPSAIAALGLIPFVLRRGTVGWLEAAVAGVVAFMLAFALAPFPEGGVLPVLAFVAGLISLAVRNILVAAHVLLAP